MAIRKTLAQRSGGLTRCQKHRDLPGGLVGCVACDLYREHPERFRPEPGDPPRTPLLDAVVETLTAPPVAPGPAAAAVSVKKPCGCKGCPDCPEAPA